MKTVRLLGRYPLTLTCIVAIWVLCLMNVPETPLDNVAFIDKWTHLVMYGGTCSVGWWEYLRHHRRITWGKMFVFGLLGPIVMSGIIELLQAYATTTRSGDWIDVAANAVGVLLGFGIGWGILRPLLWHKHK